MTIWSECWTQRIRVHHPQTNFPLSDLSHIDPRNMCNAMKIKWNYWEWNGIKRRRCVVWDLKSGNCKTPNQKKRKSRNNPPSIPPFHIEVRVQDQSRGSPCSSKPSYRKEDIVLVVIPWSPLMIWQNFDFAFTESWERTCA